MTDIHNRPDNITVLGVGNILYKDDGVGIRVIQHLEAHYQFSDHVILVDGGVLGINLLGVMAQAGRLLVVDTVLNNGRPGDIHRLEHHEIPDRILAKNSLHQVDMIEALTLCRALDHVPQTTVIGIEPKDLDTLEDSLTPEIQARLDALTDAVLNEILSLGGSFKKIAHAPGSMETAKGSH